MDAVRGPWTLERGPSWEVQGAWFIVYALGPRSFQMTPFFEHRHLSRGHICHIQNEKTPNKYSLNLKFIQPSLTEPYTGPRVSLFVIFS